MQTNANVKRSLASLSTSLTNVRSRKSWIILAFIVCLVLYLASSYLLPAHKHFHQSQLKEVLKVSRKQSCLDRYLVKWTQLMALNDAVIKKIPASTTENRFYPFSGNGKLAFGMDNKEMKFYLKTADNGYVSSYIPTLEYKLKEDHTLESKAVVMDLKSGTVLVVSAFDVERSCVTVEETFFVHRLREDVSFHKIKVRNLGPFSVELELKSRDTTGRTVDKSITNLHTTSLLNAQSVSGDIKTKKKNKDSVEGWTKFVTVLSEHPASIKVHQGGEETVSMVALTGFQFHESEASLAAKKKKASQSTTLKTATIKSKQRRNVDAAAVNTKNSKSSEATKTSNSKVVTGGGEESAEESKWTKELLGKLSSVLHEALSKEHEYAWNELWKVGVTINSDADPDSPSPLHVNLTEYYVYASHTYNLTSVSSSTTTSETKQQQIVSSPFHCYRGPFTLHTPNKWVVPTSLTSLDSHVVLWRTFFEENGCNASQLSCNTLPRLMASSVIGLQSHQQSRQQLQVALNPLSLRTNVTVRHIDMHHFGSEDRLSIHIVVTSTSNKNHKIEPYHMYVANSGNHRPKLYGCGSACEHVVELGTSMLKFVIHPTDPVTPLFYISTNRTFLESIRNTEFMRKAVHYARESKAAVTGHHMKLSPKFWISVVVLIVSFHVVIFKMIYNECRKSRTTSNRRGPYSS